MKKDSPYTFEGIKASPNGSSSSSAADGSPTTTSSSDSKHSSSGGSSSGGKKRRPRSRSPPRPQQQQQQRQAADGQSVVWQKMVKRSSPVKPRRGVLHVSLSWENLFSDADRQSKLRCVYV